MTPAELLTFHRVNTPRVSGAVWWPSLERWVRSNGTLPTFLEFREYISMTFQTGGSGGYQELNENIWDQVLAPNVVADKMKEEKSRDVMPPPVVAPRKYQQPKRKCPTTSRVKDISFDGAGEVRAGVFDTQENAKTVLKNIGKEKRHELLGWRVKKKPVEKPTQKPKKPTQKKVVVRKVKQQKPRKNYAITAKRYVLTQDSGQWKKGCIFEKSGGRSKCVLLLEGGTCYDKIHSIEIQAMYHLLKPL